MAKRGSSSGFQSGSAEAAAPGGAQAKKEKEKQLTKAQKELRAASWTEDSTGTVQTLTVPGLGTAEVVTQFGLLGQREQVTIYDTNMQTLRERSISSANIGGTTTQQAKDWAFDELDKLAKSKTP